MFVTKYNGHVAMKINNERSKLIVLVLLILNKSRGYTGYSLVARTRLTNNGNKSNLQSNQKQSRLLSLQQGRYI